jgi:hypothetical protein
MPSPLEPTILTLSINHLSMSIRLVPCSVVLAVLSAGTIHRTVGV